MKKSTGLRKAEKLILTALCTLMLCGCTDNTEVRDRGFVRTIGCDGGSVKNVSVRMYGGENVLSGQGGTIFSAVENAETTQKKNLFIGHLELLLLTPDETRDTLSVMIKNNRISPSCSLVIVPENAAAAVSQYKEEELPDLLSGSSRKGKIAEKNISAVLNDLFEEDGMAAVPVLNSGRLTMGVVGYDSLAGTLSEEESEGFCWLTEKIRDKYLTISVNGSDAGFHIRKSTVRLTARPEGDSIGITTEIKINGNCVEEGIDEKSASRAAAERISALCSKTISKTVTGMNADVLGIVKAIKSENIPMGSWQETIPRLRFYYTVKISS